jgi:sugar-specific transcriptional regulator TrmB
MDAENLLKQKVVAYLKQLGLSNEQGLAYLFLLQHGPQTVLALSRGLKTGRTKLYPLLEDLAKKQLITIHERHYGTSYEAQPPDVLEFLIAEKERKAEKLRSQLHAVTHALVGIQAKSPTTSKIIEYHGVDGLKQMNFNLTKADKEFRVFELASLPNHLGKHFAEKNRQAYADNGLISYDLTNNPDWKLETEVVGYEKLSHARYIDPSIFTIEFETYIYNNCVALLNYEKDDIFGVEIYNEKLARQQTQLFDLLWSQASVIQ